MLGGELNATALPWYPPQHSADAIIFKSAVKFAGANGRTLASLILNMNAYASIVQYSEVCAPPNWIVPAIAAQMGVDRRNNSKS